MSERMFKPTQINEDALNLETANLKLMIDVRNDAIEKVNTLHIGIADGTSSASAQTCRYF